MAQFAAQFNVGFATDIGLKREKNQDAGGTYPDLGLFVVADGMGGHRGGEIASAVAVETVHSVVERKRKTQDFSAKAALTDAIQTANRAIFEKALKESELHGMGTTTTALLFDQDQLSIGHVGDSRAYFIRRGAIWQLTRDHSFVAEKLRAGLITREQAKNDQTKNVITRSVGFGHDTQVEVYQMTVKPGDVFLVCSDGLSGQVEDNEIYEVVEKNLFQKSDIKATVDDLISWSNARGGHDNTTVLIVQLY